MVEFQPVHQLTFRPDRIQHLQKNRPQHPLRFRRWLWLEVATMAWRSTASFFRGA